MRHARRSLSGKLMVVMLTTTAIALAAAGAALLFTDLRDNRAAWADELDTEAAILSLAVQPALSFNDREGAQRNLNALQARASIRAAALYGGDGALFAQYVRPANRRPPARAPDARARRAHRRRPRASWCAGSIQGGEHAGHYLPARAIRRQRPRARLSFGARRGDGHRPGRRPAGLDLAAARGQPADGVDGRTSRGRSSRSATTRSAPTRTTSDEIGVVIDAFNKMLDEVEARSRALETSEKLYRAIGESINYGVWVTDAEGRGYLHQRLVPQAGRPDHGAGGERRLGQRCCTPTTSKTPWPPGRNAPAPAATGIANIACWASTGDITPSSRRACPSAMPPGGSSAGPASISTSRASRTPSGRCSRRIAARTNSWRRWPTSCAIRWRRSATRCAFSIRTLPTIASASGAAK